MSFGDYILQGAEILQIKPKAIREAAADQGALNTGLAFIVIAGAATALGSWTLPGLLLFPLIFLIRALIHSGIVHFLATRGFGGRGTTFGEYFRPLSLTYLLDWLVVVGLLVNVIPLLGPAAVLLLGLVINLWKLVVDTVIAETVYGLERSKAVAVIGLAVAAIFALFFLASLFFGAAAMSSWLIARS
jgi:hypothetical protein